MKNTYRVSLVVVIAIITSFQSANLSAQITPGTEVASLQALFELTEPGQGRAAYDPRTGEVFAAIGSSDVLIYGLDQETFINANLNNDSGIGTFQQNDAQGIGIINNPGGLPAGVFNIGAILPADPSIGTADDFAAVFPTLRVRSGVAGTGTFSSRVNVLLVAVPEPSSFSGLMTLVVTGCCLRRRQR